MHFQKKWLSLKPQHLQSKAKLHSLLTVLWSIWTDFFPIRETHVCFPWKLLRSLLHFQKKVIIWKLSIYIVMKHSIHSHHALKFFNRLLLFHRIKSGFLLNDSQKLNALKKKWLSLKPQYLQSKATIHSLLTVIWNVWTDCISFRVMHVSFF